MKDIIFLVAVIFLFTFNAMAQPTALPHKSCINVLSYGQNINDGVTDATDAIDAAIDYIMSESNISTRSVLYFPAGTYKVSRSVGFRHVNMNKTNGNGNGIIFWGENKSTTKIKLTDDNPLFQDFNNPRPVITFANDTINLGTYTNIAFMNSLINMTIDVGGGNPAAIGVRYIANNQGTIRDVDIITTDLTKRGVTGIDMMYAKIPGPAYLNNITITGFDYGMKLDHQNYATVMENIQINDTKLAGIYNKEHVVSINKLNVKSNSGKGIINDNVNGVFTLLNANFQIPSNQVAVKNTGYVLLKNITKPNGGNTYESTEKTLTTAIDFYVKNPYDCLYSNNTLDPAMIIEPEDEPIEAYDDTTNWVSVTDFGYTPGSLSLSNETDCGPAIKSAIAYMNAKGNENKTTLYFPRGIYKIKTNNIEIYGNVKRIVGSWASIMTLQYVEKESDPLFIIDNTKFNNLIIEAMNFSPQGSKTIDRRKKCAVFENRSSKNVVLRNIYVGHGKAYYNNGASGQLFLSDVAALSQRYYNPDNIKEVVFPEAQPQFDFGNQTVFARQLNPEQNSTHIITDNGKVWILGIKSEEPGIVVHARNNAVLNLYGGTILPSFQVGMEPIIKIENSQAFVSCAEHVSKDKYDQLAYYYNIIEDVRGENSKMLNLESTYKRNSNYASVITYYMTNSKSENSSGLESNHSLKGNKLYPVPTQSILHFELDNVYNNYSLFHLSGQKIQEQKLLSQKGEILLGDVQAGMYILRFSAPTYNSNHLITIE